MRSRPNLDAVSFDTFVLIQQSTERWNLFEWKQCILLALIFYRGRSPRVEWKHCFQLALIFYRGSAHEIEYLSHRITVDGIVPLRRHVDALLLQPHPQDVRGLQRFLGMINFYRRFLHIIPSVLIQTYNRIHNLGLTLCVWTQIGNFGVTPYFLVITDDQEGWESFSYVIILSRFLDRLFFVLSEK